MNYDNDLLIFYLDYISEESLKKVLLKIISFFQEIEKFDIKLVFKEEIQLRDVQIFYNDIELKQYFGNIGHPFSMIINKTHFSFYIRGKNNIFRNNNLCNKFGNCHKNPSGEPIIKLKNQKEVDELFNYIFSDTLNLKLS